jgi:hypothetical protein
VLDPVRVGDVVAVSSPPMPPEACSPSSLSVAKSSHGAAPLLAIRRVAAVAGDELIASDNGDIIAVPPGCVWITCDNSNGDISSRVDSRVVGPVSVYELCGRALSIVSACDRPAALSTNSLSVSEDLEWARLECYAAVRSCTWLTSSAASCTQFLAACAAKHKGVAVKKLPRMQFHH